MQVETPAAPLAESDVAYWRYEVARALSDAMIQNRPLSLVHHPYIEGRFTLNYDEGKV